MLKKIITKFFFRVLHSEAYVEMLNRGRASQIAQLKKIGLNSFIPEQAIIKNPQYISIGDNFSSLYNLRLEAWDGYIDDKFQPELIIGDNVSMNTDCHIGCINKVSIGNNVLMASRIYISDHSHGQAVAEDIITPPHRRRLYSKGPVIIEDNVWIGEGVAIMPGITIGANAIIGANAVVTRDVPTNAIVAGNPAKIIRMLA